MSTALPWSFRCEQCSHDEPASAGIWRCPACGGALALDWQPALTAADLMAGTASLWRYAAVLPIAKPACTLGEGLTPLVAGTLAGRPVWFKHDALLPTGSFKDRGAAVLVAYLRQLGKQHVIVDSSGNAAAALAGYSAAAGIACTVYAPATTSPGKLVQSRAFGATVHLVSGNREAVATAAQEAAAADPTAFYASHNWHPVFVDGVKTWALEVWEQLGQQIPPIAFIPTGGGSAFVGAWRGFAAVGQLPQLVAVQPTACAPIVAATTHNTPMITTPGTTLAEGTKIGAPARTEQIRAALRDSHGWAEAVSEAQLIAALRELWEQGIYVEPTAALGAAACRAYFARTPVPPASPPVVLLTGSGLKATETIAALLDD